MSLKEIWEDKIDGQDDILSKDINDVAHQAIENEKNIAELSKSVNNKLDKTIEASKVYGTDSNGKPTTYAISGSLTAGIAMRNNNGQIPLPSIPINPTDAASKQYADACKAESIAHADTAKAEAIAHTDKLNEEMNKRVENLEYLNLSYTEDSTIAYEKTVPSGVAPYALLKSIGGASKASKNILNPNEITSNTPITVNEDGSFSVTGTWIDVGYYLPAGTYHFVCEANDIPLFTLDGNTWFKSGDNFTLSNPTQISIGFGEYEEPKTITAKIAIFEGSTEREYEPFYSGFKHAEVEAIENIGANLLPFPYQEGDKTIDGITYTIQSDGGIRRTGTATSTTGIILSTDIEFEDGKTYYKSPNDLQIAYKRADGNTGYALPSFTWSKEYTLIKVYLQTNVGDAKNEVAYPMISSTKTDYIPYREPQVIEIPEAVKARDGYGMGKNYIRCNDGKVEYVQAAKSKTMTSSLLWGAYPQQSLTGAYVYYTDINDKKVRNNTSICSAFENISTAWAIGASGQYSDHPTNTTLYFCSDIATLGEWKAWLKTREDNKNPVVIEYELAEPIVTDITHLFPKDSEVLKVEGGGTLRFVNEHKMEVPNTIQYVTKKEQKI